MCGICGIYDRSSSAENTIAAGRKALQTLHHRGPDDEGEYSDDRIFLGHKRLSIIDVSFNGHQPVWSNNKRYVCIFNGEIYNYQEHRESLINKGYTFKGHSDSEILPNMYQEFGLKLLDMIKGIFAIALYDTHTNQLFLMRDRLGVKPLYYHINNGYLSFGSELKSILADERVKRKVDYQAIYDFLSLIYIPEPATGFEGIYSLLPGHYLVFDGIESKTIQYDFPEKLTPYADSGEAEREVEKILKRAVNLQLVSDVPIGTFLSGGIDSSIVTAFSVAESKEKVNSFTVKFPDQDFDESYYAMQMSKYAGTVYNELHIEQKAVDANLLKEVLEHFDQPFADSSSIPTLLISKMIHNKITVALSGDGGDEFFAGYEVSWRFPFALRLKKIPVVLRKMAIAMLLPLKYISTVRFRQYKKLLEITFNDEHVILQNFFSYLKEDEKEGLFEDAFLVNNNVQPTTRIFKKLWDENPSEQALEDYSKRYSLPGDMLKKVDMMSMKASIEVRVPLLYEDVITASRKIPRQWKYKFGKGKLILRNILKKYAPEEVVNKKKWGFGIPLDKSLTPDALEFIKDTLHTDKALIYGFIKKDKAYQWLDLFFSNANDQLTISRIGLYHRVYMLLSIELWLQKYKPC